MIHTVDIIIIISSLYSHTLFLIFLYIRFLCGREKKFGLNLQAVCDHMRRFIALDVGFPGSTSDFLSFLNSYICRKLNEEGTLVSGMCFYGDAAYANNLTIAVPYKGAQWGPKGAYNFYHSQLSIINVDYWKE